MQAQSMASTQYRTGAQIVCVADPDPIYRGYLATMITGTGRAVITVADGDALMDSLESGPIDCLLLDQEIALSGRPALRRLLRDKSRSGPPVIALAAAHDPDAMTKTARAGIADYLLKRELQTGELSDAINTALRHRRNRTGRGQHIPTVSSPPLVPRMNADSDADAGPGTAVVERRCDARQRVFKRGKIFAGKSRRGTACTIRDLSNGGARLQVDTATTAPEFLRLVIEGALTPMRVRLRWQIGDEMGVQFIGT
jgi:DNA-binding response OmpR family regulator